MTAEATGQEHITPVRLAETSVTERATFRKCRRQWFLAVVHRLRPRGGVNENFWLGELVHAALQAYYEHDETAHGCHRERCADAAREALDTYARRANEAMVEVQAEAGFLWEQVEEHWAALDELGHDMVKGYIRFDRESGGLGQVEAIEQRYRVRIPRTRDGVLSLRVDLVVVTASGRRIVVDHKTAASRPSESLHDIDDQFTAYFWGYQKATGEKVDRVTRNVLLKRPPMPPKLVKNGKALSVDRRQATTYELFLEAIKANGFSRADYAEHLEWLASRGYEDFYVRQTTIRSRGQLAEFEANLAEEWRDMRAVAAQPRRAYPNVSPFTCPSCPVRAICTTMMDRGDVSAVIRSGYIIGDERE
jgi:hypothetical protein